MPVTETIRWGWFQLRSVATADFPTATHSYNPATTVTDRLASRMMKNDETPLEVIRCAAVAIFNALELRARLPGSGATCTFHIFGRRSDDPTVKLIASVLATAGSQTDADGNYFATTLAVQNSYWPKSITQSSEPSGSGMCTIFFDTMGWSDFWIGTTAISAGTVYFDYAGF